MTPAECREAVRLMFVELYPRCTVIYSYPNSVRPPLPYVVLDFERIEPVNSFEYVKNGILWQEKCKRIPFSAELVTESKTEHAAGVKKVGLSTAVDDLEQATQFFDSQYAGDKMRAMNITVCTEGSPEPIHNSAPGVERARCSFYVDFVQRTKEYAALAPIDGEYSEDHASAASKKVADIMHYAEPCRASQMKLKMVQDEIISRYTEPDDNVKRFWFDIARGEVHLLDP